MAKKPTQKAINQFQALASRNQVPVSASLPKVAPKKKKRTMTAPKPANMMMPGMPPKGKGMGRTGGMMGGMM